MMLCMSVVDPCPAVLDLPIHHLHDGGTLRYQHESTAKVAIFANLRKYLPIFLHSDLSFALFLPLFPLHTSPFSTPLFPFLSPPC